MGYKKLVEWAKKRHYHIHDYNRDGSYVDLDEKIIGINSRLGINKRTFDLAHECGHILINEAPSFKKKYPIHYALSTKKDKRLKDSKQGQVEEIKEEIEAWDKGKDLLNRLKIRFDEKEFDKRAAKCIFTYIMAAKYN